MKSFLFACAAFLLLLPLQARAQFSDWEITHFHADITIHEDGSLLVQEQISVDFGELQKHGIFRFIPVVYKTQMGNRQRIELDFLDFQIDETDVPVTTYRTGGNQFVQLGDPDFTISGEHVYKITYLVERALLFFDGHDELYWNVTGHDYEVPIVSSSAIIRLPGSAKALQVHCYTGVYLSTEECGFAQESQKLVFVADKEMTVAVGFTSGVVSPPTQWDRVSWFLKDNWLSGLPLLLVIIVALYWWKVGRDVKVRKTVIVQYTPPDGVWALYAGVIDRGYIMKRDVIALIINLATEGYIRIEKKEDVYFFERLKSKAGLDDVHAYIYAKLFKGSEKISSFLETQKRMGPKTQQLIAKKIKAELSNKGYFSEGSWMRGKFMVGIGVLLVVSPFISWLWVGTIGIVLAVFSGIGILIFAFFAPKLTADGAKLRWHIQGLKLFLKTAEKHRIKWQEKEHEFVRLLPYAIALGMTKYWTGAFSSLFGENRKSPFFYTGEAFQYDDLQADIVQLTHAIGTASSVPRAPGSSSLSGGGFSGGGFGGGGGGSW